MRDEGCRCFWWEEGEGCLQGVEGIQETCPLYMPRVNPATGNPWPPLEPPPGGKSWD